MNEGKTQNDKHLMPSITISAVVQGDVAGIRKIRSTAFIDIMLFFEILDPRTQCMVRID